MDHLHHAIRIPHSKFMSNHVLSFDFIVSSQGVQTNLRLSTKKKTKKKSKSKKGESNHRLECVIVLSREPLQDLFGAVSFEHAR